MCRDINEDLEKIDNWFYNNLLSFNVDKTNYLLVFAKGRTITSVPMIHVKDSPIRWVTRAKYLGLNINEHLLWDDHIDHIAKKVRPILAVLRKTAYIAHIHSHFLYMASVWGGTTSTGLETLQKLQNKALRFIFWNEYRSEGLSTSQLFRKHRILNMGEIVKYEYVMTIFKIRHQLLKVNFTIPQNNIRHQYATRRRSLLQVPQSRTNYNISSLFHEGINLFNELPVSLRHWPNVILFKRLLKQHLCG